MTDRPLRPDAERNRQLLLTTAATLMAREGLEVSYEDIARAAGTGMGTVYRRFPDRQHLIDALFAEHIDTVVDLAERAGREKNALVGLTWFMREQLELEAGNRGLGELLRGGGQLFELVVQANSRIAPLVATMVRRAVRAGQLARGIGPGDFVMVHLMVGAVMDATRALDPQLWRRSLHIALAGLHAPGLPGRALSNNAIEHLYGVPEN